MCLSKALVTHIMVEWPFFGKRLVQTGLLGFYGIHQTQVIQCIYDFSSHFSRLWTYKHRCRDPVMVCSHKEMLLQQNLATLMSSMSAIAAPLTV